MRRKDVLAQEECKHGIWPPNCCTICTHKPVVTTERLIIVARWNSKFQQKCHACGSDIEVGEPMAQDTEDRYLCESCST